MTDHRLCADPACAPCNQVRAAAGFCGDQIEEEVGRMVTCPQCSHQFNPDTPAPVRVTESVAPTVSARAFADPAHLFPVGTETEARESWARVVAETDRLTRARVKAALRQFDIAVTENATEARINGKRSFDDLRELVRRAVRARMAAEYTDTYCWAYIVDLTDTDLVYMVDGDRLYQCAYTLDGDVVSLGEPVEVERTYAPAPAPDAGDVPAEGTATESTRVTVDGIARVLEAKGTDSDGGRIFRVRIIRYGDSKNARRYPESVLKKATSLYEGAKAFDHHRTEEEMRTGTIAGLVGYYSGASASTEGIEADLHLLPSATHAAEALDAALTQETTEPLVGISHDVMAKFRSIQEGARHLQEATEITSVYSADIVAHPAAGGQATRVVAGGVDTNDPAGTAPGGESTKESEVPPTKDEILAAFKEATDGELAAVGLSRATTTEPAKETAPAEPTKATETDEATAKHTFLARRMIADLVTEAELPREFVKVITDALPANITESMVTDQIAAQKSVLAVAERASLLPTGRYGEGVTKESRDKKILALDHFFISDVKNPDYGKGYRSFREAFIDITGKRPSYLGADFNRMILRESFGAEGGYDSEGRTLESMDSGTWNLVLGDSITRRLVAEYDQPELMNWKQVVSSMPPINDFRAQRIDRIGGYGVLPIVNQGQPYQPLTSPTNQEITYAIAKRGGTEDITWEMIVNDDVRAIQKIPTKLGLAAAQTLYRFVWDIFVNNAATSYDATALFHALHNNTAATALSQTNLSAARKAMRKQTAYGDSSNVLSIVPKFLMVCSDLEEIAFQLSTSAVAIPATPAGPTDTPNLHQGLTPIIVDYWSSTTQWHLAAAPGLTPTIEVGFFQGRQLPELFTQADQTVGSMFNADKITYKIRHVYGSAVLDHVGLFRGNS